MKDNKFNLLSPVKECIFFTAVVLESVNKKTWCYNLKGVALSLQLYGFIAHTTVIST